MAFFGGNQKSICEERVEVKQISENGTEIKWGKSGRAREESPKQGEEGIQRTCGQRE